MFRRATATVALLGLTGCALPEGFGQDLWDITRLAAHEYAQAQLAKVGEVVLEDGTYVGQVLGAKASPYRVIIFDAGGLYRVAQVSKEPTITAGGDELTLSQFGKLLSSTDPDDAKLANGNYQVIVRNGLVTSIRKSQA